MSFVDWSFCVNSCHFRGVCYNDSGVAGCVCDDPASAVDCAPVVASSSVCDGLLLLVVVGFGFAASVLVLAVIFVVAVVVVGRRSRRDLGVSPQKEATELREIHQASEQSVLNAHYVVEV